ncbi:MAG: hypothetical protein ACUVWP_06380 [bacterium]
MRMIILLPLVLMMSFLCCINIEKIDQPESIKAGGEFKVEITGAIGDTSNSEGAQYHGLLGVLIPKGWEVSDAKYSYTVEGELVKNNRLATALDMEYPAPNNYEWFGFISKDICTVTREMTNTKVVLEFKIISGKEKGTYNLDYRLGVCTKPEIIASDLVWGDFLEPITIDVK